MLMKKNIYGIKTENIYNLFFFFIIFSPFRIIAKSICTKPMIIANFILKLLIKFNSFLA
jgi:hypothetical protein